jgi:hypothetical protein
MFFTLREEKRFIVQKTVFILKSHFNKLLLSENPNSTYCHVRLNHFKGVWKEPDPVAEEEDDDDGERNFCKDDFSTSQVHGRMGRSSSRRTESWKNNLFFGAGVLTVDWEDFLKFYYFLNLT